MPGAQPLVTVAIPTWNRLPLLREAIASVQAQRYDRWEIVVADDGSDDGSVEWVRQLGDPRIRLDSAPHSGHIGRVRNRGVAAGSGELVAFLDSDDVWLPHKLERQVPALLASGREWCYADCELMDGEGRVIPMFGGTMHPRSGWIAREVLETRVGVSVSSLLLTRDFFGAVGGFAEDPRLRFRGDHEFALRLAMAAPALALPEALHRVREHPGRVTASLADPFERSALVYELFLEGAPPRPLARIARRLRSQHLAAAAGQRLYGGEVGRGAGLLARSLAGRPRPWAWLKSVRGGWLAARGARGQGAGAAPRNPEREVAGPPGAG